MEVTLQTVWTVIAFVLFIGIVLWAFNPRQKKDFDEASRLPLDDDSAQDHLNNALENTK